MNIVLLDDIENHNKQFKALLLNAIQKRHIPAVIALETTRFDDVLDYAASNPPLTVYYLDICLNQEQDGLDVCRRLRRDIARDQFIFVSAYPHYAMDCLKLHAYDFLLKPVEALAVEECLASLYREIAVEDQTIYELNIGSRMIRIPVNQIYYLTAEGKKLRKCRIIRKCTATSTSHYREVQHSPAIGAPKVNSLKPEAHNGYRPGRGSPERTPSSIVSLPSLYLGIVSSDIETDS